MTLGNMRALGVKPVAERRASQVASAMGPNRRAQERERQHGSRRSWFEARRAHFRSNTYRKSAFHRLLAVITR